MFTYKDFHQEHLNSIIKIESYVIEKQQANKAYALSKIFFSQLSSKAFASSEFCDLAVTLLRKKSSLSLKELLRFTTYNESILSHFNAFSLIDTCINK